MVDKTELKDEERTRCEVWTRVMGYHRPVSSYNIGKVGEFKERVFFTEPQSLPQEPHKPAPQLA